MDLINKYILRAWANLLTCFGFLSVLFACQSIYNFLLDLLRAGEPYINIVKYFAVELIVLLPILLIPISFLFLY